MKKLVFVLIIIISAFLSCSINRTSNQKKIISNTVLVNNTILEYDEDFSEFILRFHSDTLFQSQRIIHDIVGYDSNKEDFSEDTDTIDCMTMIRLWDDLDLKGYLDFSNQAINDTIYTIEYDTSKKLSAIENIYIPASSCFYVLEFKKNDGKWFLYRLDVHEL